LVGDAIWAGDIPGAWPSERRRLRRLIDSLSIDPELDVLTPTEVAVATLVAKGYTNRQIAFEREISVKTVEEHVSSILEKLTLTNRSQVTRWVVEHQATGGPSSQS